MDEIRVFLVDDHRVVRTGLAAYLGIEPGMRVVGQASDGRAALDEIAVLDRAGELPDVILMDLKMPRMNGIALIQDVRSDPAIKLVPVVVLTAEPTAEHLLACVRAGATGFLAKPPRKDELKRELGKAQRIRLFRQSPVLLGGDSAERLEAALKRIGGEG